MQKKFQLYKILHILDDTYKEIFMLRVFSELSYKDIGKMFNNSENWVRAISFVLNKKSFNYMRMKKMKKDCDIVNKTEKENVKGKNYKKVFNKIK